jgi:hypothetical protein
MHQRLLRAGMPRDLADWLSQLVIMMLRSSTFEYDGVLYSQADGTGIGAPYAPSYAGIFVAHVEETGLRMWRRRGGASVAVGAGKGRRWRPGDRAEVDWFHRYRDDVIGLFRGTKAEFPGLVQAMNSVDQNIKYTSEIDWESNQLIFLDVVVTIDSEGFLRADLHTKPNSKNKLLLPASAHPPFVTRSLVYSLALRVRRICCSEEDAEKRFGELAARLRERGYQETVIDAGISRARAVTRVEALRKVNKGPEEAGRQHRLIVTYDRRSSPGLGAVLKSNHESMVAQDQRLGRVFPRVPKPVYRRGRNLKEILCRAKLPPARPVRTRAAEAGSSNGLSRCSRGTGKAGCVTCSFITSRPAQVIKSVKINSTGMVIPVEGRLNCKTKGGFLYLLWSAKAPALQYLGSSGQTPGERLAGHRSDINNGAQKAVAEHFRATGSRVEDLIFIPFKRIFNPSPAVRLHFEHQFLNRHDMIDSGINRILT